MRREVFGSSEELTGPETLSAIEGRRITDVHCEPFHSVDGLSGGKLWRVGTNGGAGRQYVLKRFSWDSDWVMRATGDERGRAIVSWQTGLLDRLPPEISAEVVACARDGSGWAVLLNDVSAAMIPPGDDHISEADNEQFMEAMAALNAEFWDEAEAVDPALGFCSLHQRYSALAPRTLRPEASGPDPIPPMALKGWELLPDLVDTDVAAIMGRLLDDPTPLVSALTFYPQTVVHGDWKLGNLGIHRGARQRVVLLDWAFVGPAPPAVELAWYLAVNCARLPVSKEATIAHYRQSLRRRLGDRFDDAWWRPQLELGLLGGFLQLGWPKAYGAARSESEAVRVRERAELAWWSERVREGARWL